jgi:hypothetical protein
LYGDARYLVAAKLNEGLGRMEEASHCAGRAEELDRACLGVDHETYLATKEVGKSLMIKGGKGNSTKAIVS